MKKSIKKVVSLAMGLTVSLSCVACGGRPGLKKEDNSGKAKLSVHNYAGGFGGDWLDDVEKRFEKKYADYEFIPGTKGVDVVPTHSKSVDTDNMEAQPYEVYFTQRVYYQELAAQKKFLEITDIVKEDLTAKYGESGSIFDKMSKQQQDYFTYQDKIYALPRYAGYHGITYDIDLFEEKNFYYAKGGCPSEYCEYTQSHNDDAVSGTFTSYSYTSTGEKSAGPDGTYGTQDDGLPATYDEFFNLCDKMQKSGATPFTWSGASDYTVSLLDALHYDYEGAEQAMLNYSFSGTATHLVDSFTANAKGEITAMNFKEPTQINNANGYQVYEQAGRAYALSFMQRVCSNPAYYSSKIENKLSHTEAQLEYLQSKFIGSPIAFFIDGIYWVNEAKDAASFTLLEGQYGAEAKMENRNLGFLTLPKATMEQIGEELVLYDSLYSAAFINANIDTKKIDLAKMFLQFCFTDEELVNFNLSTNTPISMEYDMGDKVNQLSPLGKSVVEIENNPKTKKIYPYSNNPLVMNNATAFSSNNGGWSASVGVEDDFWKYPINTLLYDKTSAKAYFEGIKKYRTKALWDGMFSDYIN